MSEFGNPHEMIPSTSPAATQAALGPPAGDEIAGLGAGEMWQIVKQRKLFIAIMFVVFYLMVMGATLVVYRFFPAYTAEGYFQLDAPSAEGMQIERALVSPDIIATELESEALKLTHLDVLSEVLRVPEIMQTEFYKWYDGDIPECLYDLQSYVRSAPIRDSNLIQVRLACKDAVEAQLLVNTIMTRFEQRYRAEATRYYRETKKSLGVSKEDLEDDLKTLQLTMSTFRATVDIPNLEADSRLVTDHLARMAQSMSMMQANLAALQAQLTEVRRLGRSLPITPEMKMLVESDPVLRFWRQQVEVIGVEIASARSLLMGENHRHIKLLKQRARQFAELEVGKREELMNDLRERELNNLEQLVNSSRTALMSLQEDFQEQEAKRRDVDKHLQEYGNMQSEEERLEEALALLEQAFRAADHALADSARVRLKIVQLAQLPFRPSRPNLPVYLGGGFLLSILGSFGLAFLREFTDNAIRTPIDVARHGRLSVLGTVPNLDDDEADVDEIENAARIAPQSLVAESFRQICTNLLFSGPAESQRSILITSPSGEDGKTAVAINLAVSMARGNHRVLLIDCNFRRPGVRAVFSNTRAEGLSNILVGQSTLDDLVTNTDMPNLDVLSTGPMPPTPAELLGTRYMRELISEAVKKYDRVILDGPPVLLVSDALVLATQVDGVVVVTRAVNNSKGALKRTREQLAKVNARVLGGVLNGVQTRPGGYFKKHYREYYDYASDETIPRELPQSTRGDDEEDSSA